MAANALPPAGVSRHGAALAAHYARVRAASAALCAPLGIEDQVAQSMPDASPAKWHLAHTTWFFERFLLREHVRGYAPFDGDADRLWNSYYEAVGARHPRPERGLLTRPTLGEVHAYRAHVDAAMERWLPLVDPGSPAAATVELGLAHEQQHQELIVTDVKHLLSRNPLQPACLARRFVPSAGTHAMRWIGRDEGLVEIGAGAGVRDDVHDVHDRPSAARTPGFAFDNEGPRHRVWLEAHELASRLVTNGEYAEFVRDGGYRRPELWLSDGWATVQQQAWTRPLYWSDDLAAEFTLAGLQPLDPARPVCHLSAYEADAYARWAGARLPTEAEWEALAAEQPVRGHFADSGDLHPRAATSDAPAQLYGDCWEWTSSAYAPYPGFRTAAGALGEYNGKFMCNQLVLRGGSCATPSGHVRASYRNFFPPHARWQYAGVRLARDPGC
jgi:ergothioneine biosynthesis protein EgtB